jgi:hypothetical protein
MWSQDVAWILTIRPKRERRLQARFVVVVADDVISSNDINKAVALTDNESESALFGAIGPP